MKIDSELQLAIIILDYAINLAEENKCIDFTFEKDIIHNGEPLYVHATGKTSMYGSHRGGVDEEMYFRLQSASTVLNKLTVMGEDQEYRFPFEMGLINTLLDTLNT
jgi:hypothetical protein